MRLIGHLPDERLARRFADYLLVKKMASQVEPEANGQWAVWVHDDDHLDEAAEELKKYRVQPDDSRYRAAAAAAAERRINEQKELEERAKREHDRDRIFQRSLFERLGICTSILMMICIVVFAIQFVDPALIWKWLAMVPIRPVDGDKLAWTPGGFLPEVRDGELWRLITPIFVHGGPVHLIMNLLLFAQLGSAIESRYGWNRLLTLVIVVAVFSNLIEYIFNSPAFCGLSGVVFGLFGFIWTQWKYFPGSGFVVPLNLTILMLFWFVFCITGLAGPIANFVHWGGLASGAVIGYLSALLSRGH
jgi:GlpG protein